MSVIKSAPQSLTSGEILDEALQLLGVVFVAGPPVLLIAVPWLLFGLMLTGPFALLVALAAVLVVVAVLLATLVGILAMPFVLVRRLHRSYRSSPAVQEDADVHVAVLPAPQVAA